MAFLFGFFQFIMPIFGYFLGTGIEYYITTFDHWIAALLLFIVGGKMFLSSSKKEDCASFNNKNIFLLSIATSIDALVVGISIGLLNTPILAPALAIGVVTFFMSCAGFEIGKKTSISSKYIKIIGALVLCAIGAKILIEHLLL